MQNHAQGKKYHAYYYIISSMNHNTSTNGLDNPKAFIRKALYLKLALVFNKSCIPHKGKSITILVKNTMNQSFSKNKK